MSLLQAQVEVTKQTLSAHTALKLSVEGVMPSPKTQRAGLILMSDTDLELGSPQTHSAQLSLYDNDAPSPDDQVFVIGKNVDALRGQSVSFAHVTFLHGIDINAETFYQFCQRYQRLLDQPGVMAKATAGKVWLRCAHSENNPICFEQIAATFIARTHEAFPAVKTIDTWFITDPEDLIQALETQAADLQSVLRSLKEGVWKDRGFDYKSCQLTGHCGNCSDKKTCQSIRKIESQVRLKRRQTQQGN